MDKYTKAIFTVIAIALAVIAFKLPMTGIVHAQLGDGCGRSSIDPCYVDYKGPQGLSVFVTNLN